MTHGCWFAPTERELSLMFSDISTQISHTLQCQEYHVTDLLIIGFF